MKALLSRVYRDESGATMVEYGVILAMLAVAAFIAFDFAGRVTLELFERAVDAVPAL